MDKQQRKRIIDSQRDAFIRYGYHPHALYWSDSKIQTLRFDYLLKIGIQSGDSLLDVGCGFGDLAHYIEAQGIAIQYTGIDLSPELIKEGQKRYPNITLIEGDLFDLAPQPKSFDYVFLSGTLNRDLNDDGKYAYKTLKKMYETCRIGLAFNLLNAHHEWTKSRWDLQSFYPKDLIEHIEQFQPKPKQITLYDEYLDNDFTLLVWK